MSDDTTTIEVSYDVWSALDKRKEKGGTFDSVIRRLINNSPVPMGNLKETDTPVERVDIQELETDEDAECHHYDVVSGERCGNTAAYVETIQYGDGDPSEMYLCDEHAPDDVA